jgi:hypothetical protein
VLSLLQITLTPNCRSLADEHSSAGAGDGVRVARALEMAWSTGACLAWQLGLSEESEHFRSSIRPWRAQLRAKRNCEISKPKLLWSDRQALTGESTVASTTADAVRRRSYGAMIP